MADVKISALPASSTPLAGTEILPIVQSATTRQVSVANLTAGRAVNALSITASSLTSGRVTFAGASGLLSDSVNLTFDGTNLTTGGSETAARFIPSNPTVATNGMFLPAGNTIAFSTNSTERARIESGGTLVVGTTSASITGIGHSGIVYAKQLNDTSGFSGIQLEANANTNLLGIGYNGSVFNFAASYRSTGGYVPISFTVGGSEAMRITTAGLVGIGTSSPTTTLAVAGGISGTGALNISGGGWGVLPHVANSLVVDSVAGATRLFATGTDAATFGKYIIYTGTTNSTTTQVAEISATGIFTMNAYGAGAATFSAAGVISSVSDETWKTKDGVPTNTDAMLQKLEPGYWFYNEEKAPTFGQERQLGFYAQNVHEAIGEEAAPTPQEGKPWGYHDRSVLAISVMSLKNALNTIEELKQRITALENK